MSDSWVEVPDSSPFTASSLPYGIFDDGRGARVGVAIGSMVLDAAAVLDAPALAVQSLNPLMAAGPAMWREVREQVVDMLCGRASDRVARTLLPSASVSLRMPVTIGDYTDFYSSRHHAENAGRILRPGTPPLTPNWLHLPVAYTGRASTVVVSGTRVRRPSGPLGPVTFGPSEKLDFEAEVGFLVGQGGEQLRVDEFDAHVFGMVLVNDWSARDIQRWEGQPLGPHLGKSFATSMSAWVLPLAALDGARIPGVPQDPAPLPYLADGGAHGFDLTLRVSLNGTVVSRPPFGSMYWTAAQQLAHLTVNGARVRPGDLYASGTVSGSTREEWGSLLELTEDGTTPIELADGSARRYLQDGDVVEIGASAGDVHLAPVSGVVVGGGSAARLTEETYLGQPKSGGRDVRDLPPGGGRGEHDHRDPARVARPDGEAGALP